MFAWLLRIPLAGLVSMLTLQDVFLDSSWQGTFKGGIIDLFTSHCSKLGKECWVDLWEQQKLTACFSDELNWPQGVPFAYVHTNAKHVVIWSTCICPSAHQQWPDLGYYNPIKSISTFLYFGWLVLLSCLHFGITNLSVKEGLSQTASYGSFTQWSDALFLCRFADVFTGRMKLFLIFLFLGSTGSFLWFSLLCQQIIPFSRGEYRNLS